MPNKQHVEAQNLCTDDEVVMDTDRLRVVDTHTDGLKTYIEFEVVDPDPWQDPSKTLVLPKQFCFIVLNRD